MKYSPAFLITLIVYLIFSGLQADASGDFAYGRHPQLTYYITPDTPEIHAGEVATFTITVKIVPINPSDFFITPANNGT